MADVLDDTLLKDIKALQDEAIDVLFPVFRRYRNFRDIDLQDQLFSLQSNLEILIDLFGEAPAILRPALPADITALEKANIETKEILGKISQVVGRRANCDSDSEPPWFSQKEFRALLKKIKSVCKTYELVKLEKEKRLNPELEEDVKKALNWLSPSFVDPARDQAYFEKQITPGTATWIFERDEYKNWENKAGKALWINSPVQGIGKTVLSSSIIRRLLKWSESRPGVAVVYFYCDNNFAEKNFPFFILGSILKQLYTLLRLWNNSPVSQRLKLLHKSTSKKTYPLPDIITGIKTMIGYFTQVYIVVDGLEECPTIVPTEMTGHLFSLAGQNTNVIMSSLAWHTGPFTVAPNAAVLSIDYVEVQKDIATYLDYQLKHDFRFRRTPRQLKKSIKARVLSRSHSRFRWTHIFLESLARLLRDSTRRRALNSIPTTLELIYRGVVVNMSLDPDAYHICLQAMAWLCHSLRPLTLGELTIAALMTPDQPFTKEHLLTIPESFLDFCGPFIRYDPVTHAVTCSHVSVRQFFTSQHLPDGTVNPVYLDLHKCYATILTTSFSWFDSKEFIQKINAPNYIVQPANVPDLTLYACYFWSAHARIAQSEPHISAIIQFNLFASSSKLVNCEKMHRKIAACFENPISPFNLTSEVGKVFTPKKKEDDPPLAGPLYHAAHLGFPSIVGRLLEAGADPNQLGGVELYPIITATKQGHRDVVNVLIEAEADINVRAPGKETLLHLVLIRQWWDIAKDLLATGADVEAVDELGRTPLLVAIEQGYSEDLDPFITENTLNQANNAGTTPIFTAIMKRRVGAFLHLIKRGCNVHLLAKHDHFHRTLLQAAIIKNVPRLVQPLLEAGADPNATDPLGRNALHVAIVGHQLRIAKILKAWMDGTKPESDKPAGSDQEEISYLEAREAPASTLEMREFAESIVDDKDHCMLNAIGLLYVETGDLDTAKLFFDRCVQWNPLNAGCKKLKEIRSPSRCNLCVNPIVGKKWLEVKPQLSPAIFKYRFRCGECQKSVESQFGFVSEDGIVTLTIPSQEWIEKHLERDEDE